jgi:hypothetical protein
LILVKRFISRVSGACEVHAEVSHDAVMAPAAHFSPDRQRRVLMSTHPRTTTPTWDYNRRTALFAEVAGFDFLLAGAPWTTLGGRLDFQRHRFESVTMMTALAALTWRIRLASIGPRYRLSTADLLG